MAFLVLHATILIALLMQRYVAQYHIAIKEMNIITFLKSFSQDEMKTYVIYSVLFQFCVYMRRVIRQDMNLDGGTRCL